MGPGIEDELGGESTQDDESLESLLRTTDRDTEEVVEALREGGVRTHVSEGSVDDIIAEFSRPQSDESDGAFALSGGPTRTVSTTGIDEVFETLEDEAPPLSPDPRAESTTNPDSTDDSSPSGSDDASTAPNVSPSSTGTGVIDRQRAPQGERFDTAVEAVSDDDGDSDSLGTLSGGGPTRTVSEESVDDILALVDDEPDSDGETSDSDDAAALRPDDPEGELVALLTDEPPPVDSTGRSSNPTDSVHRSASTRSHSSDREGGALNTEESTGEDASNTTGDDTAATEAGDTGDDDTADSAGRSDSESTVDTEQSADDPGQLVTQTELEEIAALATETESMRSDRTAESNAMSDETGRRHREASAADPANGPIEYRGPGDVDRDEGGNRSSTTGARPGRSDGPLADSAGSEPTQSRPESTVRPSSLLRTVCASVRRLIERLVER